MRRRAALPLLLVAAAWIVVAPAVPERSRATTLADIIRPVEVTITDQGITVVTDFEREEFIRGGIGDFRIVNEGSVPRNFAIGVQHTPVLAPGEEARLEVEFPVRGPVPYRATVNRGSGHSGVITVI
jgi:hypothetical protein